MNVDIRFPSYDALNRAYVTWRPVEVTLRLVGAPTLPPPLPAPPLPATLPVALSGKTLVGGGQLAFATTLTHLGTPTLVVNLKTDGTPQKVWVGGRFPSASTKFGDVALEARAGHGGPLLGSHPLMVRVRKDANLLSAGERDRFLAALATLNGAGTGRYNDFRDMHVGGAPDFEAHGGPGFLPWHRAYLLDFERELQAIDGQVALPYWRFDKAAPSLFATSFIGKPNTLNQVQFAAGHPLLAWVAFGPPGVQRGQGVGPTTVPNVRTEVQTLALGGLPNPNYNGFRAMQSNPHNPAHMSHVNGWITNPTTAPRDPLFFLLHCNVDRLWAKWQFVTRLHDPNDPRSFTPAAGFPPGHRLPDLLWPWCGPLPAPRPATAPGGGMAASPMTNTPGSSPKVGAMIDYLGTVAATHHAFAYDDVPFQK
jgi:tyrosinase